MGEGWGLSARRVMCISLTEIFQKIPNSLLSTTPSTTSIRTRFYSDLPDSRYTYTYACIPIQLTTPINHQYPHPHEHHPKTLPRMPTPQARPRQLVVATLHPSIGTQLGPRRSAVRQLTTRCQCSGRTIQRRGCLWHERRSVGTVRSTIDVTVDITVEKPYA